MYCTLNVFLLFFFFLYHRIQIFPEPDHKNIFLVDRCYPHFGDKNEREGGDKEITMLNEHSNK